MKVAGDTYRCDSGDMPFSVSMDRGLRETFLSADQPDQTDLKPTNWGGEWFCPRCGVATVQEDGIVSCPKCDRSLNPFLYRLVELHPHTSQKATAWSQRLKHRWLLFRLRR